MEYAKQVFSRNRNINFFFDRRGHSQKAKHNQAPPYKAECLIDGIRFAYSSIFLAKPLSRYRSKAMAKVRYTMCANLEYGM